MYKNKIKKRELLNFLIKKYDLSLLSVLSNNLTNRTLLRADLSKCGSRSHSEEELKIEDGSVLIPNVTSGIYIDCHCICVCVCVCFLIL